MTPEEKHIQLCSSFISQIRGIYLNIESVDNKREFIMTTGGYSRALDGLDMAISALEENIELFSSEEDEED